MDELTKIIHTDNIRLSDDGRSVVILDQTQLPNRVVYLTLSREEDCYEAIAKLRVRGAPAIGIFAGYAMYVLAQQYAHLPYAAFAAEFHRQREYLNASRPTAVNLNWALKRMERVVTDSAGQPVPEILDKLHLECTAIHQEDIAMCTRIA